MAAGQEAGGLTRGSFAPTGLKYARAFFAPSSLIELNVKMSRHDVAVLTLRAFALYAWFQALDAFAGGAMTVFGSIIINAKGLTFVNVIGILSPSLIYILVGLFLFRRSRELASWLLPLPSSERDDDMPPHPLGVASVAFAVIGVAFSLHAVPTLMRFGVRYAQMDGLDAARSRLWADSPQLAASAIQLALGFFLFVKARTFATAWWRKQQPKISE